MTSPPVSELASAYTKSEPRRLNSWARVVEMGESRTRSRQFIIVHPCSQLANFSRILRLICSSVFVFFRRRCRQNCRHPASCWRSEHPLTVYKSVAANAAAYIVKTYVGKHVSLAGDMPQNVRDERFSSALLGGHFLTFTGGEHARHLH
jgi:hypothetical protein